MGDERRIQEVTLKDGSVVKFVNVDQSSGKVMDGEAVKSVNIAVFDGSGKVAVPVGQPLPVDDSK